MMFSNLTPIFLSLGNGITGLTQKNIFTQMQFEFNKGKAKVQVGALKNQLFCRKKTTVTKFYTTSGYVSDPLGFKKMP